MKPLYLILFVSVFLSKKTLAQVGIGNTSPNATLDISATNASTPNNNEGLLIPRIDEFPAINPTSLQDGMLVFVTGSGTPSEGFYYWDQATTTWVAINGAKNTLDEAYDQGGVGNGRIITADNGALEIQGGDGLEVSGAFGTGASIGAPGSSERMSFNPRKASFRAGSVDGAQLDETNVGDYSTALGRNTTATGDFSVAFGLNSTAQSYGSLVIGSYNILSGTTNNWVTTEPIFVIGNGTDTSNRSNAFTVLKNGKTGIGANNPQSPLHIDLSTSFDLSYENTGQDGLFLVGSRIGGGLNTIGASISFGAPRRSSFRRAAIAAVQTSADIDHVGLVFYTHSNGVNQSDMTESMRLTHNGNLGLNNTDPDATLDVIGTFQYEDGNEASGYVLTSDASGNASWQAPATAISKSVVQADLNGNQAITASTITKITFDQIVTDRNNEFDTTNNQFVVSNDGYYHITTNIFLSGTGTYTITITKNGAPPTNTIAQVSSNLSESNTISISTIEELVVNDYLEVYIFGTSNTTINQSSDLTQFNVFQID